MDFVYNYIKKNVSKNIPFTNTLVFNLNCRSLINAMPELSVYKYKTSARNYKAHVRDNCSQYSNHVAK